MKRFLTTILAILYMATATGTTVHLHYCMGKLVSAGLIQYDDSHLCGRCGMKKSSSKKGCCKDETKQFRNGDQLKASQTEYDITCTALALVPVYDGPSHFGLISCTLARNSASAHAPPIFRHTCPIYIEERNIRI